MKRVLRKRKHKPGRDNEDKLDPKMVTVTDLTFSVPPKLRFRLMANFQPRCLEAQNSNRRIFQAFSLSFCHHPYLRVMVPFSHFTTNERGNSALPSMFPSLSIPRVRDLSRRKSHATFFPRATRRVDDEPCYFPSPFFTLGGSTREGRKGEGGISGIGGVL